MVRDLTEKFLVGHCGKRININSNWHVLDIGSGHKPHIRANILLDKDIEDNLNRSGQDIVIDKRLIEGNAESMPFKDGEFDYIIASHIAEHVNDPEKFCKEIIRVGKRGYIETPSKFGEILLNEPFHKWYVYHTNGTLVFERKKIISPFIKLFSDFFYSIFYINIHRTGKKTIYFDNNTSKRITNFLVFYLLRFPWTRSRKFTYTCFEWENSFHFKIVK